MGAVTRLESLSVARVRQIGIFLRAIGGANSNAGVIIRSEVDFNAAVEKGSSTHGLGYY